MIVAKAIKPGRFKSEAFREAILAEMQDVAGEVKKDFEKTTATWDHKPKFEVLMDVLPDGPQLFVGTDDQVYNWVSGGTKGPYLIFPKNSTVLAFPSGYQAKTTPNVVGSKAGGSYGTTVFAMHVTHPGIEARNFDELIQIEWSKKFLRRMEEAMRRGATNSGHATT